MTIDSTTWRKASALVPLAVLSGGWTVMLAVSGAGAAATSSNGVPDDLADAQAIEVPASLSSPGQIASAVPATATRRSIVKSTSTSGIPAAALAAYQRAAQVVDSADPGCNVEWSLIAAIGRVESDHGRYGGNVLSTQGVSTPGIYGIALNGSNGTARIIDTDAGQYDNDQTFDRAVGPMQFIPSTWSVVGVDGDGDKKRNPQDIDDAALATAVYLCSGKEDLSTPSGVDSAVFRYNHSNSYVALVKSIAASYSSGEFTQVPTNSYAPTFFGKAYADSVLGAGTKGDKPVASSSHGSLVSQTKGQSVNPQSPASAPAAPPQEQKSTQPDGALKDVVTKAPAAVVNAVSDLQKAIAQCQASLTASQLNALGGVNACAQAFLAGGTAAVNDLLGSLDLGAVVTGLLGKP